MGFTLAVSPPQDGTVIVALEGELDASTVPELRLAVAAALETRPGRILVDASGVTFADSVALGALVAAYDSARVVGTTLTLTNTGPFLTHLLDITGLAATLTPAAGRHNGAPDR